MSVQNSRDCLKRLKMDPAELDPGAYGAYKTLALASHRRPFPGQTVAQRPADTVRDRGATLPLPGEEWSSSSSGSSESSSSVS